MSSTFWLTLYVLAWPAIVAGTLTYIVRAFMRDAKEAKEEGRSII